MQDRVSLYPGRVKLEPVAGQANFYDLTRADQPTQEGTPLNKANLLSDATETAMFGASANRTVDEAFAGLAAQIKLIMNNTAVITLTLQDSAGHALPGVLVQGILTASGQAVYSGTDGVAAGYIGEGSQTLKVTDYADIEDYTETINVTKGTSITKTLTLTTRNFLEITSSRSYKFSSNVNTVDTTVGAAGGSGAPSSGSNDNQARGGNGGGMGSLVEQTGISVTPNTDYPAIVGSGAANSNGGDSSFLGVSATGGVMGAGAAGAVNGSLGGNHAGYDGATGTQSIYKSFDATTLYGGAGGGGPAYYGVRGTTQAAGKGGTPGGGKGNAVGTDGTGGGGGGGRGYVDGNHSPTTYNGKKGGNGKIAIRMHLKSAT